MIYPFLFYFASIAKEDSQIGVFFSGQTTYDRGPHPLDKGFFFSPFFPLNCFLLYGSEGLVVGPLIKTLFFVSSLREGEKIGLFSGHIL